MERGEAHGVFLAIGCVLRIVARLRFDVGDNPPAQVSRKIEPEGRARNTGNPRGTLFAAPSLPVAFLLPNPYRHPLDQIGRPCKGKRLIKHLDQRSLKPLAIVPREDKNIDVFHDCFGGGLKRSPAASGVE